MTKEELITEIESIGMDSSLERKSYAVCLELLRYLGDDQISKAADFLIYQN